jgi:hypothetical protein
MTLEDLRNQLVRYLAAVKPFCHEYDHRAISHRVARFLEPQPASDTPLGYRHTIRRGVQILDDIRLATERSTLARHRGEH